MNVKNRSSAIVLMVGDQYFAGFGGGAGIKKTETITKLHPALFEARFLSASDTRKAGDYIRRLAEKGYKATAYEVQLGQQLAIVPRVL